MQVFFDFDGPILDCSVKYHNLYKRLLAEQGYEAIALYEYWQKKRDRWKDIEIAALTASNDFLNRYQELRQQLIEDQETLKDDKMWPHVPEMLEQLTSNYEVNLVTLRNRRSTLLPQLDALGIRDHFTHILSEDNNEGTYATKVELVKPHLKSKALIIGDTEVDILAGRDLGIQTLAVTCGMRNADHLRTLNPDAILASSKEIFDHLP